MFLKNRQKISSKVVSLVFGILILCFALGFWALAWEEPSQAPPGDNVPAPLNVGSDYQVKTGELSFQKFYDSDPTYYVDPDGSISAALSGKVGIGTTTPGIFKLYVDGKIRSALISESDSDDTVATKGYVDAANGGGGGGEGMLMLSAKSGAQYTLANAMNYCRDLTNATCTYMADESTCPSGTFDDWRLPIQEELALFILHPSDSNFYWVRTVHTAGTNNYWIRMNLSSGGNWSGGLATGDHYVRCVRNVEAAAGGGGVENVGVTMLSAEFGGATGYTFINAVNYCRDLTDTACAYMADESTCTGGTFSDWRLPTVEELRLFILNPNDDSGLWTRSISPTTHDYAVRLILSNAHWSSYPQTDSYKIRCVR